MRAWRRLAAIALGGLAACAPAGPQAPAPAPVVTAPAPLPLSPDQAFPSAQRVSFHISPDGKRLVWIDDDGRVRLGTTESPGDGGIEVPIATDARIDAVVWAETSEHLIVMRRDESGARALLAVAVPSRPETVPASLTPMALTGPMETVVGPLLGLSPSQPGRVVALIRETRRPRAPVLVSLDIATGERVVLDRNVRGFSAYYLDGRNRPRVARQSVVGGAERLWRLDASAAGGPAWRVVLDIPAADRHLTRVVAVGAEGNSVLLLDSIQRDRAALVEVDLASGAKRVLGESRQADVTDALVDPATRTAQAFWAEYLAPTWTPLTPGAQADFATLAQSLTGAVKILSRARDDGLWVVGESSPIRPPSYALYDRRARQVTRLSNTPPANPAWRTMTAHEVPTRDGQTLVAHLTLPAQADPDGDGRADAPAPLVLLAQPLDGQRERAVFRPDHQFLASRGYAVLSINTRGVAGLGKAMVSGDPALVEQDWQDGLAWAQTARITAAGKVVLIQRGKTSAAGDAMFACRLGLPATEGPQPPEAMWQSVFTRGEAEGIATAIARCFAPTAAVSAAQR